MDPILRKYFNKASALRSEASSNITKSLPSIETPPRVKFLDGNPANVTTPPKNTNPLKALTSAKKVIPVNIPTSQQEQLDDHEAQLFRRKSELSKLMGIDEDTRKEKTKLPYINRGHSSIVDYPSTTLSPFAPVKSAQSLTSSSSSSVASTFHKIGAKFNFYDNHNNKREWKEEMQGGGKVWVNIRTNEVSTQNPFQSTTKKEEDRNATFRVKTGPIPKGTAANLYDQSAVAELFRLLDNNGKR